MHRKRMGGGAEGEEQKGQMSDTWKRKKKKRSARPKRKKQAFTDMQKI